VVKQKSNLIVFVIVMFLSSCSGTGRTMGGLIPAPKNLDGKVVGDMYFSALEEFKVRLPHPPNASKKDEYEWKYTQVNEIYDKGVVGVIFGPAALDLNMYHAVLIRAPMKEPKEKYVADVFAKKAQLRNGVYIQKENIQFQLNGKLCFYAVYESDDSYLVLSLTDHKNSFYAIEADIPKKSHSGSVNLKQLINRQWSIFNNMLNSFVVLNSKYEF